MSRADRRRKERQIKKDLNSINNLTQSQTRILNILSNQKAQEIAASKIDEFGQSLDRALSATLLEKGLTLEECVSIQDRMDQLIEEDIKKIQNLKESDMANIDNKIREVVNSLLNKKIGKKEAIDELLFTFPKLSRSMLTNAYIKIKEEVEGKKRVAKEEVYNFFSLNSNRYNGKQMIENAIEKFGFTESTAQTYYYKWKGNFMRKNHDVTLDNQDEEKVNIKEKNTETKKDNVQAIKEEEKVRLKIKQMIIEGKNGTYTTTETGIELKNASLNFKSVEELDNFTEEYKKVFAVLSNIK